MTNILSEIENDLGTFAEHLKSSVVPVVHDGAELLERFSTSKIVQEVQQLAAPLLPADEELVAGMIRSLGAAAARIAELTAPPAEPAPEAPPAEPAA